MLIDYSEVLTRLQAALGREASRRPGIINVPGRSIACRIDPEWYLAVQPGFVTIISKWAAVFPKRAAEALLRTAVMAASADHSSSMLRLTVFDELVRRPMQLRCAFIQADWIDRALTLHGKRTNIPPVSRLRIASFEKERIDAFFLGKTAPLSLAYAPFATQPMPHTASQQA